MPTERADEDTKLLVDLLREAAHLEHCLLNTYLFAACSLKSLPEEFATLSTGEPNRRRAIQYERVRGWKQAILFVTHEEMMHLHYVQCLLRALGEVPEFGLPERSGQTGDWVFDDWRPRVGGQSSEDPTSVPVDRLTSATIRRFVLYEASDALQDADPFGSDPMELYAELHDFELNYRLEEGLLGVPQPAKTQIHDSLYEMYTALLPGAPKPGGFAPMTLAYAKAKPPHVQFRSIADLYRNEIRPRYEAAFKRGQVIKANIDLNDELKQAKEGFLPTGPVYRDKNFEDQAKGNVEDPLKDFDRLSDIIDEIVEEGEGMRGFLDDARDALRDINEYGMDVVLWATRSASIDRPFNLWVKRLQRLRNSHLYRFAMIQAEMNAEEALAAKCGEKFFAYRRPPTAINKVAEQFVAEAVGHFNACYLVLRSWLSRFYDTRIWEADQPRRKGLQVMASWPLMSIAIRPFLELLGIVPVDTTALFRSDAVGLADGPAEATELARLFDAGDLTTQIADDMDNLCLQIFGAVAKWAKQWRAKVPAMELSATSSVIADRRLAALVAVGDVERQFYFRASGGYSDELPSADFLKRHPDGHRFEETPMGVDRGTPAMFSQTLVLRLRFAGRCLVQMATDPDPPTDESGCTGTQMLYAADGPTHFDRALVMRPEGVSNLLRRPPVDELPPLGVRVTEVAVMSADAEARAAYAGPPKQGVLHGVELKLSKTPQELLGPDKVLGVNLLPRDGVMPYLVGENHLVWRDGEPIDPFVLAVELIDAGGQRTPALRREIFNEGLAVLEMNPLQRALSSRGPLPDFGGIEDLGDLPEWVHATLSDQERTHAGSSSDYLTARAEVLGKALAAALNPQPVTQDAVDEVAALFDRRRRVAIPRSTTFGWLGIQLFYSHTISGVLQCEAGNALMSALSTAFGQELSVTPPAADRHQPNSRWLINYALGYMDTDQQTNLTYGELYIPLTAR